MEEEYESSAPCHPRGGRLACGTPHYFCPPALYASSMVAEAVKNLTLYGVSYRISMILWYSTPYKVVCIEG